MSRYFKEKGFKPHNKDDKYEARHDELFAQLLDFPAFVETCPSCNPRARATSKHEHW